MWREYGVSGWVGGGEDGEERRGVVGREEWEEERGKSGGRGEAVTGWERRKPYIR